MSAQHEPTILPYVEVGTRSPKPTVVIVAKSSNVMLLILLMQPQLTEHKPEAGRNARKFCIGLVLLGKKPTNCVQTLLAVVKKRVHISRCLTAL